VPTNGQRHRELGAVDARAAAELHEPPEHEGRRDDDRQEATDDDARGRVGHGHAHETALRTREQDADAEQPETDRRVNGDGRVASERAHVLQAVRVADEVQEAEHAGGDGEDLPERAGAADVEEEKGERAHHQPERGHRRHPAAGRHDVVDQDVVDAEVHVRRVVDQRHEADRERDGGGAAPEQALPPRRVRTIEQHDGEAHQDEGERGVDARQHRRTGRPSREHEGADHADDGAGRDGDWQWTSGHRQSRCYHGETVITLRRADERGHADHGWLDTYHTFSFAEYHDVRHMGYRDLRVINDDRVRGGHGFPPHGHRDMEIVTYVLEGALQHRDDMGNGSVITPGDVQRMSAGTGVVHSEFNASKTALVHLLQIWILPRTRGTTPGYEEKRFEDGALRDTLRLVAAPDGRDGAVTINQDVSMYASRLSAAAEVAHPFARGRFGWLHVAQGAVRLNGEALAAGDGAAISGEPAITVTAAEPAEILLFDLA
jgi:quercetin 2,3-dioxygenase